MTIQCQRSLQYFSLCYSSDFSRQNGFNRAVWNSQNCLAYWNSSKITADSDCSYEIERHFLLERKAMTNLDSILISKDITLLTKVLIVNGMVFPDSSVQLSHSVMSKSLRPHESQHARTPCPLPTPGVGSDSCASNR